MRASPRCPIVMVTGHEDSVAISRAFEAGATDFISKPVNWALLPRRLAYILRNAAAAERIERLAYFDTLTGLPNRQRCIETAERLFAEAASGAAGGRGHLPGPQQLQAHQRYLRPLGRRCGAANGRRQARARARSAFRPRTHACRSRASAAMSSSCWCGMPGATPLALEIASACCRGVQASRSSTRGSSSIRRRASASPSIPTTVRMSPTVLKHADTAMYQAKTAHRGVRS